jgi:carboxyl-terminal processing protease
MPVVIAPIDNSPAYEAGIKSGDVIVAIDGTLTADLEEDEWTERIRGDAGTDVSLSLLHQGDEKPYDVTITRQKIIVDPVSWRMLPGNVAWVKLSEFSQGATDGLVQALGEAKAEGAEGLILDLRNNPGGFVFEAVNVGSQFLPDGSVLFREQDREGNVKPVTTPGNSGEWLDRPVVVLVNEGSASAAEIVSSALRDNERATLIGETTFGTGTVLLPFELSDGSVVQLGTQLWLTADGDQIWKRGVAPDEEVVLDAGTYPALPIDFTQTELTPDQFSAVDDGQLTAGYEAVQQTLRQQ